jgi:elongation factor P--(R)-beta-lysine ligase
LTAERGQVLARRAALIRQVRQFFHDRRFLEVETPLAVPSPGLDVHLDAVEVRPAAGDRWLATSPEYQMKRLLAEGLERIFQISKCFRKGERGPLHHEEFTMLEWYRARAGSEEVMADTETLVASLATGGGGGRPTVQARGQTVDVTPPWPRMTVEEAFQRYAGVSVWDVLPNEDRFFRLFVDRIQPRAGHGRATFLVRWPAAMASLARLHPDDPRVADRFEAFIGGVEICNGFGELVDPVEQRARLERDQAERARLGKPVYPIDERFLAALERGVPPSGGNALGLDRLIMWLLGQERLDDVVAIPPDAL